MRFGSADADRRLETDRFGISATNFKIRVLLALTSTEINRIQRAGCNMFNSNHLNQQNSTDFNKSWNLVREQKIVFGQFIWPDHLFSDT
jgi:hypothetical protein